MHRVLLLFLVTSGCSRDLSGKKDEGVSPDDTSSTTSALCNSIDDDCIREACEACVDACAEECTSLDIYPMEYDCSEGYWTVYDFCPDWKYSDTSESG